MGRGMGRKGCDGDGLEAGFNSDGDKEWYTCSGCKNCKNGPKPQRTRAEVKRDEERRERDTVRRLARGH